VLGIGSTFPAVPPLAEPRSRWRLALLVTGTPNRKKPVPGVRVNGSAGRRCAVVLGAMDDTEIRGTIDKLVAEERELRAQHELTPLDDERSGRLRHVEEQLDQCWDLLRQRRAKREFGLNPDDVEVRDSSVVEHYRQ
jgi:hypothetical protein